MARLLEHQAKYLLSQAGIAVPKGKVARTGEEAESIAEELNQEVVIKALVPAGRRGKAGAIKFASNPAEARARAEEMLGTYVQHYPVCEVLVEERLPIDRELYLSVTIDGGSQSPVVIIGARGGIDVEELREERPELFTSYKVDVFEGLAEYKARELWYEVGIRGRSLVLLGRITAKLYEAFVKCDAYIIEVNPLVLTQSGTPVAAAAVIGIDEAAVFRHPELSDIVELGTERAWRPLTDLEKQAVKVNEADPYRGTARYTEMEGGDIGFMCGGGGASLLLFDALLQAGGWPANYSEFGGNPTEEKVYGLAKIILSKPGVRGLFVAQNITNNTQVDVVARGVLRALEEMKIDPRVFPVVVREAGVNEQVARELFQGKSVEYYGDEITLTQAAQRMVARMREAYPDRDKCAFSQIQDG